MLEASSLSTLDSSPPSEPNGLQWAPVLKNCSTAASRRLSFVCFLQIASTRMHEDKDVMAPSALPEMDNSTDTASTCTTLGFCLELHPA